MQSAITRITALNALYAGTKSKVYWDALHTYFIAEANVEKYTKLFADVKQITNN